MSIATQIIQKITENDSSIVEYNFQGQIAEEKVQIPLLAEGMKKNTNVKRLDISNCGITTPSAIKLAEMISVNKTLTNLDLGYNIAELVGCDDSDLFLWTRMSSYSKDDDDEMTDNNISLFGLTYKPTNNIALKFEVGTHEKWSDWNDDGTKTKGDADVMRMGLGYMF